MAKKKLLKKPNSELTPEFLNAYDIQHQISPDITGLRPLSSIGRMSDQQFEDFLKELYQMSMYMPNKNVVNDKGEYEDSKTRFERLKERAIRFRQQYIQLQKEGKL